MMMKHIAVALDRVEQATSNALCLKDMVQPGTTVFLLLRAQARQSNWPLAYLTASATHESTAVKACAQQWGSEITREQENAERTLVPLRAALASAGAELRLHLYTGPLRRALAELREMHDVPLVVMHLREETGLRKVFRLTRKALGILPEQSVEADLAYRR